MIQNFKATNLSHTVDVNQSARNEYAEIFTLQKKNRLFSFQRRNFLDINTPKERVSLML